MRDSTELERLKPDTQTVKRLAQTLRVAPAFVRRLIKAGMPTDSVANALAWRFAHSKRGVGYRRKE